MAIDALELKLRPPELGLTPYPAKMITLASGEIMVVREAKREEVGVLLGTVFPLIGVPTDYYDIVACRMYEELLGWYRYRTANEFVIVGAINGVIAGIVNRLPELVCSIELPNYIQAEIHGREGHILRCLESAKAYFAAHPR